MKRIRYEAMNGNKLSTYMLYALGEIILVVVGILIAVKIDDLNEEEQKGKQQVKYYQDILIDLKKDSTHFIKVLNQFKKRQTHLYGIYREISNSKQEEEEFIYDYLLYNVQFSPTMIKNQQQTIKELKDYTVRRLINDYSERLVGVQIAIDEVNMCVLDMMRPYTLKKKIWNVEHVFQEDIFGFLPEDYVIDQESSKKLYGDEDMLQMLAYQRISTGFSISELQQIIQVNNQLMNALREKLDA
ncbi:MAG: DUF6090 family protein [Bacteroidota bacterium]